MAKKLSRALQKQKLVLGQAESYDEWRKAAIVYDELSGGDVWRETERSSLYDHNQIRLRLEQLRNFQENNDNHGLMFTLNEGVHGNMGGMGKSALYARSKIGTKKLIEEYVDEICKALKHLASVKDSEFSREEKYDLFNRASLCCGRSALMLSGGGSLGHFHLGVLKALIEEDLVPKVVSGASAGSFVAAIMGTRTKEQMLDYISSETMVEEAKEEASWFNRMVHGDEGQVDTHDVEEAIARLIPDLTFQEAFEISGIYINISVAPAELHQTSRLLNAITSPNVFIRGAVQASCAVPGVYPSVVLEAKNVNGEKQPYLPARRWVDGSVSDDLPAKRLSRLYGVNHYIGSLINPIVMFAHEDSVERHRTADLLRKLSHNGISGLVKNIHALTQKYGKDWPKVNLVTSMAHSIVQQNYHADIAIYPDFKKFKMRKILSPLSEKELLDLVRQGELATWNMMDMIRTCSKISRVLDEILSEFDEFERHGTNRNNLLKAIA